MRGASKASKSAPKKVRNELEGAIIDMYAHLHLFQNVATMVIEKNNHVQMKLSQYNTIHKGISDIDRWIEENPDAPPELYHHQKWRERQTYMH
jgi:hypothetical protein